MTAKDAMECLVKGEKLINKRGALLFIKDSELRMLSTNKDFIYMSESVIHDFKKWQVMSKQDK